MSSRRSPSMGKTVPVPKTRNDDYELLQKITKDPHYVARLKGVDVPPPPSATSAMGAPFTRNGNTSGVTTGGAWAAAPATTRASSNALGLGGGGSSAGMARLWDNHYSQDHIPNYDAVNDRFCKFNLKKRADSSERKIGTNANVPMYSRGGVASAGEMGVGRVGVPISGGRLAPLSGRVSPTPGSQLQQGMDGETNNNDMVNAYASTAAVSSSGDSIDSLFQKSRHRLLALWEELGTLEADRAPLGPAMTLLPGQSPSVENIRTITNEIQRLVDLRNAAVEVEKAIELREGFLYLLQELAERFASMSSSTPTERDKAYRELVALVTPFRNASLQSVEAIGRWRDVYVHNSHAMNTVSTDGNQSSGDANQVTRSQSLQHNNGPATVAPPYMWKGVSYLHKMNGDTYFLIHSRLGNLLEYEVRANPLLDPRKVKLSADGATNALPPVRVKNVVGSAGANGSNSAAVPFARIAKAELVLAEEASRQALLREIHHDGRILTAAEEAELIRRKVKGDDDRAVGLLRDETQWASRFTEGASANANGASAPSKREANSAFSKLSPIEIQNAAATNIQRVFKGHLARRFVVAKREQVVAATKIQRFVRKVLARKEVHLRRRQVVAACKIQALQRGVSTRTKIDKVRNAHAAATAIQKVFRGYLTRKYTDMVRYLHQCATKIQATWRSYYVRQSVRNEINYVRNEAATKIQAAWRGHHVRGIARYNPTKIQKVIKLQAWFRGTIDRAHVKENIIRRFAAVRIQSIYRMVLAKRRCRKMRQEREDKSWAAYLAVANTAATRIQSGWRMLAAKKAVAIKREEKRAKDLHLAENDMLEERLYSQEQLVQRHKAATKIQALVRGHLARQQIAMLTFLIECAVKIQKVVRGRLGRIRAQSQRAILVSYMEEKSALPDKDKVLPSTSYVAETLKALAEDATIATQHVDATSIDAVAAVSPKNGPLTSEAEAEDQQPPSVSSSHDISAIVVAPLSIDHSEVNASGATTNGKAHQQQTFEPFLVATLSISPSHFSEHHFRNTITRRASLPSAENNIEIINIYKGSTNVCFRIVGTEEGSEAAMAALVADYKGKAAIFRDLFAITMIRSGTADDLAKERADDIPVEAKGPYSPTTRSPLKKLPGSPVIVSPITATIQLVPPTDESQPIGTHEPTSKPEQASASLTASPVDDSPSKNSDSSKRKRKVSIAVGLTEDGQGEEEAAAEVIPTIIGDADIPSATEAVSGVPKISLIPKIELLSVSPNSTIRSAMKSPRSGTSADAAEEEHKAEASPHVTLSQEIVADEENLDAGDAEVAAEEEEQRKSAVFEGNIRRSSSVTRRHHTAPIDDASEVQRPPSPMLRSHNHMPVHVSLPSSPTETGKVMPTVAKVYSHEEEEERYSAATTIQSFFADATQKKKASRALATKEREVKSVAARQAQLSRVQEMNEASSIIAIGLVKEGPAAHKARTKALRMSKESIAMRTAKSAVQQERNVASLMISRALRVAVMMRSLREGKQRRADLEEATAARQEAQAERRIIEEEQKEAQASAEKATVAAAATLAAMAQRPDSALVEINELKRLESAERKADETVDTFPSPPTNQVQDDQDNVGVPVIDATEQNIEAARPSSAIAEINELKRLKSAERRAEDTESHVPQPQQHIPTDTRPDSALAEINELNRLNSAENKAARQVVAEQAAFAPSELPPSASADFAFLAAGSTSPKSVTSTAPRLSIIEALGNTPNADDTTAAAAASNSPILRSSPDHHMGSSTAAQSPASPFADTASHANLATAGIRPSSALEEIEQLKKLMSAETKAENESNTPQPLPASSPLSPPSASSPVEPNEQSFSSNTRLVSEGLVADVIADAISEDVAAAAQPPSIEASPSDSTEVVRSVVANVLETFIEGSARKEAATNNSLPVVDESERMQPISPQPSLAIPSAAPAAEREVVVAVPVHTVTASRPTSAIRALRQARSSRPSSAGEAEEEVKQPQSGRIGSSHRLPLEDLMNSRPTSANPSAMASSRQVSARASRAVAAVSGTKRIPSLPAACDIVQAMLRYQISALIAAYWREKEIRAANDARRVKASTTIQCAARSSMARAVASSRRGDRKANLEVQLQQAEVQEMERALAKLRAIEDDEWRLQVLPSYNATAVAIYEKERAEKDAKAKVHKAAIKIQCLWRCYNARFMVNWMRTDRKAKREAKASAEAFVRESEAALRIQCTVRRHQAEVKSKRMRSKRDEERKAKADLEAMLFAAALKIQCCVRCHNARDTAKFRREKKAAAEALLIKQKADADAAALKVIADREAARQGNASGTAAAIKIQCAWRCYNARFERRWRSQLRSERQTAEATKQKEEFEAAAKAKEIADKNLDLVAPTIPKRDIEAQPLPQGGRGGHADLD